MKPIALVSSHLEAIDMKDVVFVTVTLACFVASIAYVRFRDRIR